MLVLKTSVKSKKWLLSLIVFLLTYPIFLLLWVKISSHYGQAIIRLGTTVASLSFDTRIENVQMKHDDVTVTHVKPIVTTQGIADVVITIPIGISSFTFNVPLTFSLVVCLYPFFSWRKRWFLEVTVLLALVHFLYVYFKNGFYIYHILLKAQVISHSVLKSVFWEYSWSFIDNLLIRFEPFLVVTYLWFRKGTEKT